MPKTYGKPFSMPAGNFAFSPSGSKRLGACKVELCNYLAKAGCGGITNCAPVMTWSLLGRGSMAGRGLLSGEGARASQDRFGGQELPGGGRERSQHSHPPFQLPHARGDSLVRRVAEAV